MSSETVTPRAHARSKATRLLSAGTYLDPAYRKSVIKELLTDRFRVVAPSYGYDAVSVLAHALAARRLWRVQLGGVGAGTAVFVVLAMTGALETFISVLVLVWLVWTMAFLRRIATLQTLMTRLKDHGGGFDGAYPVTPQLTDGLIRKIDHEQSSSSGLVFYGGYQPFVGAGERAHEWSNAQLLLGSPVSALERAASRPGAMPAQVQVPPGRWADGRVAGPGAAQPEAPVRKAVVPFTVGDITSYVAARMPAELRDEAPYDQRIRQLTVERRRYTTAIRTNDRTRGPGWSRLPSVDDLPDIHWKEDYDSAREYLCVRVGSWHEELVTSMFVGFDLKGNTLHTEFYTYVLAPLITDFHLVDRLPDTLGGRLMLRVAWDTVMAAPRHARKLLYRLLVVLFPFPPLLRLAGLRAGGRAAGTPAPRAGQVDNSEFRLGRYVTKAVDCGAVTSVREMATHDDFHHFFQESDTVKYTRIVERRLLQIIRTFLHEHNVDLTDHDRQQTNILQQHFGDNNTNSGSGNQSVRNSGNQTMGTSSPIGQGA